ncbi:MAG TPA: sulfatase-like hydrolase/transferase, partial [Thermoanaerobaculia bacterium]|nr:sulfatase-like hydrolase/transferase [Thermoanaerobaculia bacterium]
YQHGLRDNSGARLGAGTPTLATRLKARGYATGAFVSAFPLDSRWGLGSGFDVYDDRYGKGADTGTFRLAERRGTETVSAALAWYRAQPPGRRFLWVHLFEPHAPYEPPPPFDALYRDAPYLGEVAAADAALAPLVEELLAAGAAPVLAILTGDHGESLGEHGEATHGLFAYDATLRIPLVVAGPRVPAGTDARVAGHVDVVPTVLEALSLPPDPGLPGRSLLAAGAPDADAGRALYFEALSANLNRGWAPLFGVVRGGLKYVDLPLRELYDLPPDPGELRNLAAAREEEVRSLARAIPPEAREPARRTAPTSEEAAKLRSLGYVAGAAPARASYGPDDDPKRLVAVDQAIHSILADYQGGRLSAAIAGAEKLVRARPGMTVALEHLAFLYQQADRLPDAARVLKAYLESHPVEAPGAPALRVRYGLVLAEMGRAKEAVAALSPLAKSDDTDALNALGIALADAGEPGRAREVFRRSLAEDPSNPRTLESLAVVELRDRKWEAARDGFRKSLAINPSRPMSLKGLAEAETALGNLPAAVDALEAAARLSPGEAGILFELGRTAARAGRNDLAAGALSAFLARTPPGRFPRERAEAETLLRSLAPGGPGARQSP